MRIYILALVASLCSAHAHTLQQITSDEQLSIMQANRVPGSNNATYGPVPVGEQIFDIEYLEIAPWPIPTYGSLRAQAKPYLTKACSDRIFFFLLRGEISSFHGRAHDHIDLSKASFTATSSAVYADGDVDEPQSLILPLCTSTYREDAHLAIRNATGYHVDYLTLDGPNDILLDMALPGSFMRSGLYTFEIDARLDDDTCLFAISVTQQIKGGWPW